MVSYINFFFNFVVLAGKTIKILLTTTSIFKFILYYSCTLIFTVYHLSSANFPHCFLHRFKFMNNFSLHFSYTVWILFLYYILYVSCLMHPDFIPKFIELILQFSSLENIFMGHISYVCRYNCMKLNIKYTKETISNGI